MSRTSLVCAVHGRVVASEAERRRPDRTLKAVRVFGGLARGRSPRIGPGGRRETYATEVTTHTNATHVQPRTGTRSTQPLLALALNVNTACYRPNGQRGFVAA